MTSPDVVEEWLPIRIAAAAPDAPAPPIWDDPGDPFALAPVLSARAPAPLPGAPVRRFPVIGWVGLALVGAFVVAALAAPLLSPYGPRDLSHDFLQGPSGAHPLGTNQIGQDLASQLLAGARASLFIAVVAGVGTVALGTVAGLLAGWYGGAVETVLMRLSDIMLATPQLPLLFVVGLWVGGSLTAVALVIAFLFWPGTARVVRIQVRSLRRSVHVKAAVGFGARTRYVLRRHIVPEIGLILVARMVSAASRAVLFEAGLAYLGIGESSRLSWGSILRDARQSSGIFYTNIWTWWIAPPVVALVLFLLGLTFLSAAIEQRVNPRLARHAGTGGR